MFRRCPALHKLERQIRALIAENRDLHDRRDTDRVLIARLRRQHDADQKLLAELRVNDESR